MTLETLASIGHELDVPRFSVEVGSETFEETSGLFTEVSVDRTISGADHFSLAISTRFDHETGEFVDVEWEDFPIGESVEIHLGYGATLQRVLTGTITEHGTDFPAGGAPTITVRGYGRYHELTKDVVEEQWEEKTDAEIVEALADAYGFEAVVDPTPGGETKVENEYDSDAAFLEEKLATRNESGTGPFDVFARLDELVFRAPRDGGEPQLTLTYGESLQSFAPTLTEAETHGRIEVRHWDPTRKSEIVGVAESEDGTGKRVIRRPVRSEDEARRIAQAVLRRERRDRLRGNGTTIGLPEFEIGEPIVLSGLGERFSGTYYVEGVTHTIGSGGYSTDFDVREAMGGVLS
ncbi:phage late control D family protein [Natronorarus salvus]|uniref:phage late control D family protein n=1 Tax=Natronorarus salvus TaxID=3117733 RepID=UPI002F26D801